MDAFSPTPPPWTEKAAHSLNFSCPGCGGNASKAKGVWLNRRAPVTVDNGRRKWQEFYLCECDRSWWGWSSDRPKREASQE
jgi:hypothetical protein